MGHSKGLGIGLALMMASGAAMWAQTLNNQTLTGKYFFRHVSLGLDAAGNLPDPRSLIGTITFDGSGGYSFNGQGVIGNAAATAQSGNGKYTVDPAGFVSLENPLRSGATINARWGNSVLVGSSTEAAGNTFDLFAAIQAPGGSVSSTLAGPYWASTLEIPGGSLSNARSAVFKLTSAAAGQFAAINVSGHAANLNAGLPMTQGVPVATYTMAVDGTGTATFGSSSNGQLLSGSRTIYVSADGNVLLGGSAGSHDFLFAVKALSGATNSAWNADYWGAGLRIDPADPGFPAGLSYAGAVSARGIGTLTWTKRYKQLGAGAYTSWST